jgi:hemoglobin/transferrin/lactoferrin receptor protein
MNRLFYCILFITISSRALAQFELQLFDKVTTLPIIGASVTQVWVNDKTQLTNKHIAITNKKGICQIEEEAIKQLAIFTISHQSIGTVSYTTYQVILNNYKLYLINNTPQLEEAIVSANRINEKAKDISRQIETINRQQLSFANQQNTADLLMNQSNVYIQKSQQGGGSPILRGFEANRVLLVIDGVRLNNAIYRSGHLQNVIRIDQNLLEKVEVLYGSGSVIYGSDALGGVISFVTRNPELNTGPKTFYLHNEFYSRYSAANNEITHHYNINIGCKKWASLTAITHSNFGNVVQGRNRDAEWENVGLRPTFVKRINNQDVIINNPNPFEQTESNYNQTDFSQKILFKPTDKQQHIINFQYSNTSNVPRYDRLTESSNGLPKSAQWFYGPEKRLLLSYNWQYNISRSWFDKINTIAAYQFIEESRNDRSFNNEWLRNRNEKVFVLSLNIDIFKRLKKHEIRYGIDAQNNQVNSTAHQTDINTQQRKALSTRYPAGGSNMSMAGLFVSHNWEINSHLILNDGIRFSYINTNSNMGNSLNFYSFLPPTISQSNHALNGNIGLIYLYDSNIRFYANVSNAFHAPNIDDLSKIFDSNSKYKLVIVPNNNLKPEQSITSEIGTNLTLVKRFKLNANVYYTQLYDAFVLAQAKVNGADSIVYDDEMSKVNMLTNKQNALVIGWHVDATITLNENWNLYGAYTYTKGRVKQNANFTPLDHIPPTYGRIGSQLQLKGLRFDLYTQFSGAKKLADYNLNGEDNLQYATTTGTPSWYTHNIKLQYSTFKRGIAINLQSGVENILDTHYRLFASGISAMGRNFYIAIRLGF